VLRLLDACLESNGFLESPVLPFATPLLDPEVLRTAGMPERIGHFRVVGVLGRGGMGEVFLAERDDGQFEQRVALKLIQRSAAGLVRRFLDERRILARLEHPGIARLVDGGLTSDGQPYFAMELVEGEPIDRYCESRQLSIERRLELFGSACDAVAYAHQHLVIHRDLKPSNILVTADGQVKLLDFGIAKVVGAADSAEERTRTGMYLMTPEFAAPEQVRGDPVSTMTDVYGLGVLLYLLLTGSRPYDVRGKSPAEVERTICNSEPAKPSATAGGARHRRLRGDLDAIVLKALRKEPERRYTSAAALREDLQRFRAGLPVLARPDSVGYRLGKFARRHRAAVTAGLLTAAGLLGATGFSLRQMREARLQRDAAVRESRRADAQVEFQNVLLSEVGDRPITMREVLDAGRDVLERQSAGDARIRTALLLQLAASYGELHDSRMREALLVRAESLALAGGARDRLPEIGCQMADNLRLDGRYEEAWRKLDAAEAVRRSVNPHDPGIELACLMVHANLANEAGQRLGRSGEAVVAARRGLAIKDSLGQTTDLGYVHLLSALARARYRADRPREAIAIYQRAIAVMDSSGRGGLLAYTVLRHDLAISLLNLGEIAAAEPILHEVLQRAARSDRSGRIPWQPVIHYAETALTQGHADSAAKYFAMIVAHGVRDTSLFWEGRGLFGLARANVQLGRLAEARRAKARLEQIIAMHPRVRNTDDQVPDGRVLDGWLALARGDTAAAKAAFLAALRTNGYFEGKRTKLLRPVVLLVAECAIALGQPQEALALAREARAIAAVDSLADSRSAGIGEARLIEARALLAGGDSAAARTAAAGALVALRFGASAEHPRTRRAEALAALLRAGGTDSDSSRSVR
jgi:tetratricopeptide (TPR) repeat protein